MKILVIHNPKVLGGSSKSLMLLVNELRKYGDIEFFFFVSRGQFEDFLKENGFEYSATNWISHFDNTRYGYYRGKRWLILLRELFNLPITFYKLTNLLVNNKFDLVILNDAPLVIYAYLIKRIVKIKILLFVRSVQNNNKNLRFKIFEKILNNYIDHIIAIDNTVKRSLPESIYYKLSVIHNGFYKPKIELVDTYIDKNKKTFNIGYLGVIYDAKGFFELLEAIKILVCGKKINDIKLIIGGQLSRTTKSRVLLKLFEMLGFSKDYYKIIELYIKKYNLIENIEFLGYVKDLNNFYNKIDLLVFPSRLNAIGRPVFEAGFYGIPSIVAIQDSTDDTFINMKSGVAIPYPEPNMIAEKIELLYNNRELLRKLGLGAKEMSEKNFDIEKNASKVYKIIKNINSSEDF